MQIVPNARDDVIFVIFVVFVVSLLFLLPEIDLWNTNKYEK